MSVKYDWICTDCTVAFSAFDDNGQPVKPGFCYNCQCKGSIISYPDWQKAILLEAEQFEQKLLADRDTERQLAFMGALA